MLLNVVGNMTSIFTQVYIAKMTLLYSFFPYVLHTVPFTSLSLLFAHVDIFMVVFICNCHRPSVQSGFCHPFSWWKSSNQSHCNLKLKVKMSILLFCLPCWILTMQNVCIHYAGVHKIPEDVLPCFDWEVANIIFYVHLIMTIYTIHVSVVQLNVLWVIYLDRIATQSPVCVNISWVWICLDKSYNSIVLPNSGLQVWVAILVWFVSTMDHSTRFTITIWKIFLIPSFCPIALCFTCQQVLQ